METETIEITKASSKGQVVIPEHIRKRLSISKGSVFAVTSRKKIIIFRKIDTRISKEDMKTIKLVEEAWDDVRHGKYRSARPSEFSKELAKW